MDWEAIGAVGEMVAAVGVIASLLFLATQIRHNSAQVSQQIRSIDLQAYDSASQNFTAIRLTIANNPQLAAIWSKGKKDFQALDVDEKAQVHELFDELFWVYENMLHRKALDAVDADLWSLVEDNVRHWLKNPGIRQWWRARLSTPHTEEFESIVDRVIKEDYPDVS
jgi:hypothetical protein